MSALVRAGGGAPAQVQKRGRLRLLIESLARGAGVAQRSIRSVGRRPGVQSRPRPRSWRFAWISGSSRPAFLLPLRHPPRVLVAQSPKPEAQSPKPRETEPDPPNLFPLAAGPHPPRRTDADARSQMCSSSSSHSRRRPPPAPPALPAPPAPIESVLRRLVACPTRQRGISCEILQIGHRTPARLGGTWLAAPGMTRHACCPRTSWQSARPVPIERESCLLRARRSRDGVGHRDGHPPDS